MNLTKGSQPIVYRLITAAAILLLAIVLLIFLGFLYYYNGEKLMRIFPPCLFYTLTGFKCPSCGLQRAIFNIVHGNFLEALKQNALVVFIIISGCLLFLKSIFVYLINGKFDFPQIKNSHIFILVISIIIFTILRNIIGWI